MHVASKPIKFGNDELCAMEPARGKCCGELRPVRALSGFDLRDLADDFPVASVQVIADCLLLCLKAKPGSPLLLR